MTIKLLTLLCGPDGNLEPGEHTLDAEREKVLVDAGCAEFVRQNYAEAAVSRRGENAAMPHNTRQRAKR
jgi:hypothetical protein